MISSRETQSEWERRAPLGPQHVRKLVKKGVKVGGGNIFYITKYFWPRFWSSPATGEPTPWPPTPMLAPRFRRTFPRPPASLE